LTDIVSGVKHNLELDRLENLWQSAQIAYVSWKIEIGQNGTEAKIGRRLRGKSENGYSGTRTFCLFDRGKTKEVRVPEHTYSLFHLNLRPI
jgi:hypothetical protein